MSDNRAPLSTIVEAPPVSPVPRSARPSRRWALVGIAAVAMVLAAGGWWWSSRLPKRFAVVEPGRLYRSGEVTPGQLAVLHRAYGIGRVICLLDAQAPQTRQERDAAAALGIEWHNIPLTGDGASAPADRDQILSLLSDPGAAPTLVHCAAGTNRTGLAVGLYRLRCQHWKLEDVLAEMRQFGFDDLPKHENLRQALAAEAAAVSARQ